MYVKMQNIQNNTVKENSKPFKFYFVLAAAALLLVLFILRTFLYEKLFAPVAVEVEKDMYVDTQITPNFNIEPVKLISSGSDSPPELILGVSGIVIDADSGLIIYDKDSLKRMPLASLVKILTAVVVIEHKSLPDYATVTEESGSVGENTMGVSAGEVYTIEELLYGLLLNSGNDAAYVLAENTAGSIEEFVKWMNRKTDELGLIDTEVYDPSGLDDRSYTTARDLAVLTEYAMRHDVFRKIVATVSKELPYSGLHKYLFLENQTNLLTTYPGVKGVKTGYTEEAGLCLSTYASNEGRNLIGVVLNSISRRSDMILMLDYGFGYYGIKVDHGLLDY